MLKSRKDHVVAVEPRLRKCVTESRLKKCAINKSNFVFRYEGSFHGTRLSVVIIMVKKRRDKNNGWIFVRRKIIGVRGVYDKVQISGFNHEVVIKGRVKVSGKKS